MRLQQVLQFKNAEEPLEGASAFLCFSFFVQGADIAEPLQDQVHVLSEDGAGAS